MDNLTNEVVEMVATDVGSEVMESVAEDCVKRSCGKIVVAQVGLVAGGLVLGALGYKHVVEPIAKKVKTAWQNRRRKAKSCDAETEATNRVEAESYVVEDPEEEYPIR